MISVLGDNKRTALVRKNIIFSFLIKGWSCLVMFLMVRLTLDYLGEYQNGVWLTISSMLVLIDNMDIGLGNGLRNTLATELAHGNIEKAREAVSTTFFMLIIVIVPVALILIGITQGIDVYRFNNVNPSLVPNLETIIVVAIIFICSTFVFKFIGNFYLGLQLPAANSTSCHVRSDPRFGSHVHFLSHHRAFAPYRCDSQYGIAIGCLPARLSLYFLS